MLWENSTPFASAKEESTTKFTVSVPLTRYIFPPWELRSEVNDPTRESTRRPLASFMYE